MIHLDKKGRELKAIYESMEHTLGNTVPAVGPLNGDGTDPSAPLYEDPAVQAGLLNGIDGNQPPAPIVEQLPLVPEGGVQNGIDGNAPSAPLAEQLPLAPLGLQNGIDGNAPAAPLVESPSAAIEDGAVPEKNGKVPCPVPMQPVGNYTGSTWVESNLRNKIRSSFQ